MLIAAAAGLVALGAAGMYVWNAMGKPASDFTTSPVRLSVTIPLSVRPTQVRFAGNRPGLLIRGYPKRPDGTEGSRAQMSLRPFGKYDLEPIAGTDGVTDYAVSADGEWLAIVAWVSDQSSQQQLLKVRVDGSAPPVTLVDWDADWRDFTWLANGDLVIMSNGGTTFFLLPTDGRPPQAPVKLDTGSLGGFPSLKSALPDDRGVLFMMEAYGTRGYQQDAWVFDPATGKAARLMENAGNPASATCRTPGVLARPRVDGCTIRPPDTSRRRGLWRH